MDVTKDEILTAMWSDACYEAARDVWYEAVSSAGEMSFRDAYLGGSDELASACRTVTVLRLMDRSERATKLALDALADLRREGLELSGSNLKVLARSLADEVGRKADESGLDLDRILPSRGQPAGPGAGEAAAPSADGLISSARAAGPQDDAGRVGRARAGRSRA